MFESESLCALTLSRLLVLCQLSQVRGGTPGQVVLHVCRLQQGGHAPHSEASTCWEVMVLTSAPSHLFSCCEVNDANTPLESELWDVIGQSVRLALLTGDIMAAELDPCESS